MEKQDAVIFYTEKTKKILKGSFSDSVDSVLDGEDICICPIEFIENLWFNSDLMREYEQGSCLLMKNVWHEVDDGQATKVVMSELLNNALVRCDSLLEQACKVIEEIGNQLKNENYHILCENLYWSWVEVDQDLLEELEGLELVMFGTEKISELLQHNKGFEITLSSKLVKPEEL
jgi:hypothetical protein